MIEMFVRTKHKIDKRHEFALVVVNDDALWVCTIIKLFLHVQQVYTIHRHKSVTLYLHFTLCLLLLQSLKFDAFVTYHI